MENADNPINDLNAGVTLSEQYFEFIGAAGKWSRLLSFILAAGLSLVLLFGGIFSWLFKGSTNRISSSSGQSSGFRVVKKQFFDVDAGFFIFSLCVCLFWGVIIYFLFRFSAAVKAVGEHRQGPDFTDAMMLLSLIFKMLVIGLLGGLGGLVLLVL
ncbi:MAG: hypothetical protein AB8H12_01005 [Lewinella sp.]